MDPIAPGRPVANPLALMGLLAQAVDAQVAGRLEEARDLYGRVLEMQPDQVDALRMASGLALERGDAGKALALLQRASALRPAQADVLELLACTLQRLARWEEALVHVREAITLREAALAAGPAGGAGCDSLAAARGRTALAYGIRAAILHRLGRLADATADIERAIAIEPAGAAGYSSRGHLLRECGQLQQALEAFDAALTRAPGDPAIEFHKACVLLLLGDYQRGWPLYESRWGHWPRRTLDGGEPWTGRSSLAGRTLLLYADQGLGDAIMLARFATPLAARGARVVLQVQQPLVGLLQTVAGVGEVIAFGSDLPPYDDHCPLFSLPAAVGLRLHTIPGRAGYLSADLAKAAGWAAWLGPRRRPRVGLAWSGFVGHANDYRRSIPLAQFVAALPAGCDYICLQDAVRPADRPALGSAPGIREVGSRLREFADTAALCSQMDLVVSVDTSVAHLAGALGRPTWILLPFAPDYRWLAEGEDCAWYASARLLRQGPDAEWAPVLRRVRAGLERLAQSRCLSASEVNESAKKSSGESPAWPVYSARAESTTMGAPQA